MIDKILILLKNNFALIISVISLCLSIYNFIYLLIIRHRKLEIQILKYRLIQVNGYNIYQFQCIITNKSQLPLSISNLSINDVYCKFDVSRIEKSISTIALPINLNSLESTSGWLEFKTKEKFNIQSMFLNCYTSRGVIKNIVPKIDNLIFDDPRI